mmetsp:Transcript_16420/g.25304  ORF Transcript_16420/g.25304 Transcript_16420/m.25304 type:complete len:562 (+) Transcript_16420:34-1719(+)
MASIPKKNPQEYEDRKEEYPDDHLHAYVPLHKKLSRFPGPHRSKRFSGPPNQKQHKPYYSSNYYFVPFDGYKSADSEIGTLSAMSLINNPEFLKSLPIAVRAQYANLCFFKIKGPIDNYLVDNDLKILTDQKMKQMVGLDLKEIPIIYPEDVAPAFTKYSGQPLNQFTPNDFEVGRPKVPMTAAILKEVHTKYQGQHSQKKLKAATFLSSQIALREICHVILSNINPGRYRLNDPLNILMWSEETNPSIDPQYAHNSTIQLQYIRVDDFDNERFKDNPNSFYGHMFESALKGDTQQFKCQSFFRESNPYSFLELRLCNAEISDAITILVGSEHDCRIASDNAEKIAEIKLTRRYTRLNRDAVVLKDENHEIRVPFWKFISIWLQCFFGDVNDVIIGVHDDGVIGNIVRTSMCDIFNNNHGLQKKTEFIRFALLEVLRWIRNVVRENSALGPLLLKTQLARDSKGNKYNQFIIKKFGGAHVSKSDLELTKLLKYGQKTHNVYIDQQQQQYSIQQVNFEYTNLVHEFGAMAVNVNNASVSAADCGRGVKQVPKRWRRKQKLQD